MRPEQIPQWDSRIALMAGICLGCAFAVAMLGFVFDDDVPPARGSSKLVRWLCRTIVERIAPPTPTSNCRALALIDQWTPAQYKRFVREEFAAYAPLDHELISDVQQFLTTTPLMPGT